jgi:hypothetical protein
MKSILLSAFALILSISCKSDDLPLRKISAFGPVFVASNQFDVTPSVHVTKEKKREFKKIIRVKAWEARPMNLPVTWILTPNQSYFAKAAYLSYCSPTFQRHCAYPNLRGPPMA